MQLKFKDQNNSDLEKNVFHFKPKLYQKPFLNVKYFWYVEIQKVFFALKRYLKIRCGF